MTVLAIPAPRPPTRTIWAGERGQLGRIPPDLWLALLEDEQTRERYEAKVYRRGPGQCAYWLGSLSSSGHGRLRVGTRRLDGMRPDSLVVVAHVYGHLLSRGLARADPVTGRLPIVRHRCDEASCQAVMHLAAGSPGENVRDYLARRVDPLSPLRDSRGPRGRAVAIRDAIRQALAEGASPAEVELAIEAASSAGLPQAQEALPF
jgi:hypothetical protein